MSLTVEGVLGLQVFEGAKPRVLAASHGLSRFVRWVHASELSDIDKYLAGGELLLSAGIGLGDTSDSQRAYIRRIAGAGAVALILEESGRVFHTVPPAVVEEAESCDLPVIALSDEVPFAAVSAQVHEHLTEQRLSLLVKEKEIDERFSAMLLDRADQFELVRELSRITGRTAVLENALHQVIAMGAGATDLESLTNDWPNHLRGEHVESSETGCLCRQIAMRGQPWGWVHLVIEDDTPTDIDSISVSRAASAVAVSLLSDRTFDLHLEQRSTALVTRLLLGDISGKDFARRVRELGYSLPTGRAIVVVIAEPAGEEGAPWTALPYIFADLGEYAVGVVPATGIESVLHSLAGEQKNRPGGYSRAVPLDDLGAAVRQAKTASSVAVAKAESTLVSFDGLGIERLLVGLVDGPELTAYVEEELGPLLEWDRSSSAGLLPTLRVFLEADGRKSEAAGILYIQRRTLYNRLDRLSTILGQPIDSPEVRQRLLLAVKAFDLMKHQGRLIH